MHTCKICKKEFEKLDGLRRHNALSHKISSQQTYNEYVLNGKIPICKCGCGETPRFVSFEHGYKEWKRGHIARVKNNWGHNQKAIDKSSKTRKEQFKNGERKVWNDGLTKETDERVKRQIEHLTNSINNNPEELKRRSDWLSTARKTNYDFRSKYGKDSANWKGGTSSINSLTRRNSRLYTEWIFPILKRDNFSCTKCGNTTQLEVHHNLEQMSEVIRKFVDKSKEYTFEEKNVIVELVIDYHVNNKVSGITLCRECHKEIHPTYNT